MKKISLHCNSGHQLFFRLTNQILTSCCSATKNELKFGSNYYSLQFVPLHKVRKRKKIRFTV